MTESSICWRCQNACRKCPWSKNFEPIAGWKAIPTKIYSHDKIYIDSFFVKKCPLFVEDEKNMIRVSLEWVSNKLGLTKRAVNKMTYNELIEICNKHQINLIIKNKSDRRIYFIAKNKKQFTYITEDTVQQFWKITGNNQF